MGNPNLSGAQFGAMTNPAPLTQAPQEPRSTSPTAAPLPYSTLTNSSNKAAAAWRPPTSNLPLSTSTFGSIFQPQHA